MIVLRDKDRGARDVKDAICKNTSKGSILLCALGEPDQRLGKSSAAFRQQKAFKPVNGLNASIYL